MKRRWMSMLLVLCMVFTLFPQTVFAEKAGDVTIGSIAIGTDSAAEGAALCENHKEHDTDCGYIEAKDARPCGDLNEDGSYSCALALDSGDVSGNTATPGDAEEKYVCDHSDGCGYAAAADETKCIHTCEMCAVEARNFALSPQNTEEVVIDLSAVTGDDPDGNYTVISGTDQIQLTNSDKTFRLTGEATKSLNIFQTNGVILDNASIPKIFVTSLDEVTITLVGDNTISGIDGIAFGFYAGGTTICGDGNLSMTGLFSCETSKPHLLTLSATGTIDITGGLGQDPNLTTNIISGTVHISNPGGGAPLSLQGSNPLTVSGNTELSVDGDRTALELWESETKPTVTIKEQAKVTLAGNLDPASPDWVVSSAGSCTLKLQDEASLSIIDNQAATNTNATVYFPGADFIMEGEDTSFFLAGASSKWGISSAKNITFNGNVSINNNVYATDSITIAGGVTEIKGVLQMPDSSQGTNTLNISGGGILDCNNTNYLKLNNECGIFLGRHFSYMTMNGDFSLNQPLEIPYKTNSSNITVLGGNLTFGDSGSITLVGGDAWNNASAADKASYKPLIIKSGAIVDEKENITFENFGDYYAKKHTDEENNSFYTLIALADILKKAKETAENADYANVTQAAYGDAEAVQRYAADIAKAAIDNADITVTASGTYIAPEAGTADSKEGHNGSYTFTITLSIGTQNVSTIEKTITITATPYGGLTDTEAVAAAKTAAENAAYPNTTQAAHGTEEAAQSYVQGIASAAVNNRDIHVSVNKVSYTAPSAGTSWNKNGTNGSYTFTITVTKGILNQTTLQKSVAITATAYVGSSSSGGSNITVTTPAPDKPNNPTQAEIKVDGKTDANGNTTITVTDQNITDAIAKAEADAKKNGNTANGVTIVLSATGGINAQSVTVNLPKTVQDLIISKKVVSTIIVVDNPDVQIGMDLKAVTEINAQAKSDVNISAQRLDSGALTGTAKTAVGSRPVFDLAVSYGNGKQVQSFGAGGVSVSIPYTLGANEKAGNVCAVYVDGSGKVQWLTSSVYDSAAKVLRFSTNHFSTYGVGYKQDAPAFTDIANHWAKSDMEYVVSRGLFAGTGDTTFSPDTAMTRGMFVTTLGRLANADVSSYKTSSFGDVKADSYYMGYIEWANKNNIMNGTGDGTFSPDQPITREQMAVVMYNYAGLGGGTMPKVYEENIFADSTKISEYARNAVKFMQMAGVLRGKSGNVFDPQGTATRAEVSAVLRRFVELRISIDTAQGWTMNDSGKWMYYENGKPVTGKKDIGGVSYTFDQNGEVAGIPKELK